MKPKRGRKIVDSNLLSDSSRAARNREYSRRHRAKCSGQREELRVRGFTKVLFTSVHPHSSKGTKGRGITKPLQSTKFC